ncbi:5288_t:CDS:2 [Ambispora gerdemannii]|uniref:5288_t:CDS:1 n=1 Tax=Ambispora gerdemannii TaxID=144530 RepID=A0A9N8UVR1_9GLOM|nr:5288_t:CDS:2 [Ambispora gerdemannii]
MSSTIEKINPNLPIHLEKCQELDNEHPINVVIMFGWTNSNVRNVSKIASYWRKKGNFHILDWTASDFPYIYFTKKATQACAAFIPYLQEFGVLPTTNEDDDSKHSPTKPKLIAHAFSNGGTTGLAGLAEACKLQNLPLHYSALIIDSAPGTTSIFTFYKIFTVAQKNPIKKAFLAIVIEFLFLLVGLPSMVLYSSCTGQKTIIEFFTNVLFEHNAAKYSPRLFIYSKTDKLVPSSSVEKVIAKSVKLCGDKTRKWCLEESDHVTHWMKHTEIYEKTVDNFIDEFHKIIINTKYQTKKMYQEQPRGSRSHDPYIGTTFQRALYFVLTAILGYFLLALLAVVVLESLDLYREVGKAIRHWFAN